MTIRTHGHSMTADAPLSTRTRFLAEALPLRAELDRAARRYTHSFHDAEDLVSETYIRAWAGFGSFKEGTNFRAWIHRILVNTWIGGYRKAQCRPVEALTEVFTDAQLGADAQRFDRAPSAEETQLQEMLSGPLEAAFHTLSESQQAAIFYADICELPYKMIAEIMGVPLGTVMSRLHRGRQRLRIALGRAEAKSA
ncbi:MAG: sigma-70 family RNA polymerase sigma factor [Mycobacterium sp.]